MDSLTNEGWIKSVTGHLKKIGKTPSSEDRLRFISGLNHELRGHINGITGLTWLLESTELSYEQKQYIASLRHSADELIRMLGDSVDMARLEEGQLTTTPQATLIEEVIVEAVKSQALTATARKLELRTKIDNALSVPVMCDPQRLRQILQGLLLVALKSSSQSILEISARLLHQAGLEVRIEIADLTDGLGNEMLGRIQTLMNTIELSSRHDHGPMGHSLCVSKCLLKMLGGKMGVDRNTGPRACLWFSLPIDKVV